ncbi:MAG: phosphotransferase KptA/Tpt1, partial [Edafosvirus sp.]
ASKFLTYVLRHNGVDMGLKFDSAGFTSIDDILAMRDMSGINKAELESIVKNNDKQRFTIKDDMIRANQGHSGKVAACIKPEEIFTRINDASEIPVCVHGTTKASWKLIEKLGLSKMERQFIHLAIGSPGEEKVISGMRNHSPVRIHIDVEKAMEAGIIFYFSDNNVILTDGINGIIPPEYFKKVEIL